MELDVTLANSWEEILRFSFLRYNSGLTSNRVLYEVVHVYTIC